MTNSQQGSAKKFNNITFDYSKIQASEDSTDVMAKNDENFLTVEKYSNRLQMPISEHETGTSASVQKFFADLSNAETKKTNFWLEKRDKLKMSKRYQDIKKYTQGIQHLSQTQFKENE